MEEKKKGSSLLLCYFLCATSHSFFLSLSYSFFLFSFLRFRRQISLFEWLIRCSFFFNDSDSKDLENENFFFCPL